MNGRVAGRAVPGREGEQGRNSRFPPLPMPGCPSRRHRSAADGTGEEHVEVPKKSRASGAGAVKHQSVPWQGRDRAPQTILLSWKPFPVG